MENNFKVNQIGVIYADDNGFRLVLTPEYKKALIGLDGFSYINIQLGGGGYAKGHILQLAG